jgi:hypothetical protein
MVAIQCRAASKTTIPMNFDTDVEFDIVVAWRGQVTDHGFKVEE